MTDVVVDSSVVAKWILPEADSAQAQRVLLSIVGQGYRLFAVDLVYAEVASAVWKRLRQKSITPAEADGFLEALLRAPVEVVPTADLLKLAFSIAARHDRSIYDALFVALTEQLAVNGVTADEPLHNAVKADYPRVILLRDWP
jgi:predicted nucleic acid-binding protein